MSSRIPLAFRILHQFEGWLRKYSRVPHQAFYDATYFPWLTNLEAQTAAIQAEMRAVYHDHKQVPPFQEISKLQSGLTQDQNWRTHFLVAYGLPIKPHLRACPATAHALQAIPGLRTAMFSCLEPGKELPSHRGPYAGLLRVHLGLEIPDHEVERCGLEVAGQVCGWRDGKAFVFDDTFDHQAWNRTDQRRIVLFLDILRPLRQPAAVINASLIYGLRFSPYGRKAIADFQSWYDARQDSPPAPLPSV